MFAEENKAIVQRFIEELWNGRNLQVADEIFATDCVTHQLRSGAEIDAAPRAAEAIKKHISEWLAGFPDLRFTVEQMIAEADRVVTQSVMQGTHAGTWLGIPPTGKRVLIRMMTIHRIRNGRIAEDWVLVESLGFFQNLTITFCILIFVSALCYSISEKTTLLEGLWWSIVTATTVGYGDDFPHYLLGKLTAVTLMLTMVLLVIPAITARMASGLIVNHDAFTHNEQEEIKQGIREILAYIESEKELRKAEPSS